VKIAATREKWKESSARLADESAKLPALQAALDAAKARRYDCGQWIHHITDLLKHET
jgi:hypothetical protein